jgi:hypothetical protein
MTPKEFATIIDADFKTMQNLIRDLGLKPQ